MEIASALKTIKASADAPKAPHPKIADKHLDFHSILNGLDKDINGRNIHEDLVKLSQAIQSGKNISAKELLFYQIRAGQFGMQIELIAKLGESFTSTIRKLEQGH